MTAAPDSKPRHLRVVADHQVDNPHMQPSLPVRRGQARPERSATVGMRPQPTAPVVDHHLADRQPRWSFRYLAAALTVLAQLAIGAAIAGGGDPAMGIAAGLIMALCGLALIVAEATTNHRNTDTAEDEQPNHTTSDKEHQQ